MNEPIPSQLEPARNIPIARTVDVLVAGGGPAGIAAGIAAARAGAETLLIERYGYLGGMITGAQVTWILGVGDGVRPKARGITREIRERLEPLGGILSDRHHYDYRVDAEIFKWQAVEMLREAGAGLQLHTWACDPIRADGAVGGIYTESKNGRRAIRARVTVDCTADADLAFRAGCACDNETHDVTLGFNLEGIDPPKTDRFKASDPAGYADVVAEAKSRNGGVMLNQRRSIAGIDIADAEALSHAETLLRREYFEALRFLQTHLPGWENARIAETRPQLGVRQGRRIRGLYTVTNDDLLASRHFDDGVARLGACLDGYAMYKPRGLDYDIPYRCMVPGTPDGLLVAGRCVSSDYRACNSLRLIVPCLATGQAAGVAAALAAKERIEPRAVDPVRLRDALRQQDVHLG